MQSEELTIIDAILRLKLFEALDSDFPPDNRNRPCQAVWLKRWAWIVAVDVDKELKRLKRRKKAATMFGFENPEQAEEAAKQARAAAKRGIVA